MVAATTPLSVFVQSLVRRIDDQIPYSASGQIPDVRWRRFPRSNSRSSRAYAQGTPSGRRLWAAEQCSRMNWNQVDDVPTKLLNTILWWDHAGYQSMYAGKH